MKVETLLAMALAMAVMPCHGQVSDMLTKQGKQDDKVSEESHCWCSKLNDALAARGREQDFRVSHLERRHTTVRLDNERLEREISAHEDAIQDHTDSMESGPGTSSAGGEETSGVGGNDTQKFHQEALKGVRDARAELAGRSSQEVKKVRLTLDDLEDLHERKLKEAQDGESQQQARQLEALRESKAKMLRLEKEAAETKGSQLASGEASNEMVSSQVAAYEKQREADATLSEAIERVCTTLGEQSVERTRLRQQALMASSQAAVRKAHTAERKEASKLSQTQLGANKSPNSVAALKTYRGMKYLRGHDKAGCDVDALELAEGELRNAEQALEEATGSSKALVDLLGRSGQIQRDFDRFFDSAVFSLRLYESKASGAFSALQAPVAAMDLQPSLGSEGSPEQPYVNLGDAVASLAQEIEKDLEANKALVDDLKTVELPQRTADKALFQVLQAAKTEAGSAVANLGC